MNKRSIQTLSPFQHDPLRNDSFEQFAFEGIVNAFDAQSDKSNWQVTETLLSANRGGIASSDTAAFGGDLAYQYGKAGTLGGLSLAGTQSLIGDSRFGTATQVLHTVGGGGIVLG